MACSKKAQDWEEAGAEFYQESYNADWDAVPRNTFAITTLLPSKMNRAGTIRRTLHSQRDSRNPKLSQANVSTTQKNNEVQSSILPDLSEILTDEERIWEEMLQIKLMPVSMQQKKELKANLQNATKLRLQGFNQFKWRHRKIWQKISSKWNELTGKFELWHSSIKEIEGHYGTGVASYFLFIRWLFLINCITFLLILVFIVTPQVLLTKFISDECSSRSSTGSSSGTSSIRSDENLIITRNFSFLKFTRDSINSKTSLLFYGSYSDHLIKNETHSTNCTQTQFEENYFGFNYNMPLAYAFVNVVYLSITLIAIVRATAREFKDRLISGKGQFYQYCNLVFSGWDFCIHNKKYSSIKHKALFNEIRYLLQSKRIEIERSNRSNDYMCKLILTRIIINILIFSILLISACFIYYLFDISLPHASVFYKEDHKNKSLNLVMDTFHSVKGMNTSSLEFDEFPSSKLYTAYFFDFLPYIAVVALNLFLPTIFSYLCTFERYSPLFVVKISLLRTIFLRLASIAIILSRFYYIVIPLPNGQDQKMFSCWENFVGQQFYKLVVTDFASHIFVTFLINFPRAFFARNINNSFIRLIGEQEFDLPKHVLDIVYSQTICWIGSFYAPFLPAFLAVVVFGMFYIKKFQCLVNSKPSKILYGSSRSNSIFMLILLLSFFAAIIPITYAFSEITPSKTCGPFKGLKSVWDAPVSAFMELPEFLKNFIFFLSTAEFAIPCFITLTLLLYYFYAVSDANKKMVKVLKNQLVLEGHDKQFLLNRLSAFLKHQDSNLH